MSTSGVKVKEDFKVKDLSLAEWGRKEIELAELRKESEFTNRDIQRYSSDIERGEKAKQKLIELLEIEIGYLTTS